MWHSVGSVVLRFFWLDLFLLSISAGARSPWRIYGSAIWGTGRDTCSAGTTCWGVESDVGQKKRHKDSTENCEMIWYWIPLILTQFSCCDGPPWRVRFFQLKQWVEGFTGFPFEDMCSPMSTCMAMRPNILLSWQMRIFYLHWRPNLTFQRSIKVL